MERIRHRHQFIAVYVRPEKLADIEAFECMYCHRYFAENELSFADNICVDCDESDPDWNQLKKENAQRTEDMRVNKLMDERNKAMGLGK